MMDITSHSRMVTKFIVEPNWKSGKRSFHILHKIQKVLHKTNNSVLLTCFYRVTNGQIFRCLDRPLICS